MTNEPPNVAAIRALLEEEVSAIRSGAVRVRAIAREEGVRVKVAVEPAEPGDAGAREVDAVAACLGEDEANLGRVAARLAPEKIDLLRWRDEPPMLIANVLSPARPRQMHLDMAGRCATVMLGVGDPLLMAPDRPTRLRLAETISGWRIAVEPEPRVEKRRDSGC